MEWGNISLSIENHPLCTWICTSGSDWVKVKVDHFAILISTNDIIWDTLFLVFDTVKVLQTSAPTPIKHTWPVESGCSGNFRAGVMELWTFMFLLSPCDRLFLINFFRNRSVMMLKGVWSFLRTCGKVENSLLWLNVGCVDYPKVSQSVVHFYSLVQW